MPMYPVQQFDDSRNYYPRYQSGKQEVNSTTSSMPIEQWHQAVYMETQPAFVATPDLQSLRQGSNTVEKRNAFRAADAQDTQARTKGSAMIFSTEIANRSTLAAGHTMSTDCHPSVKIDPQRRMTRSGSWDGRTSSQEDGDLYDPASGEPELEQGKLYHEKRMVPDSPLVVDGSGLQKSLELLSTSAPS